MDTYARTEENRFSFGLWMVGNPGATPDCRSDHLLFRQVVGPRLLAHRKDPGLLIRESWVRIPPAPPTLALEPSWPP
jgi:hypothetical protein